MATTYTTDAQRRFVATRVTEYLRAYVFTGGQRASLYVPPKSVEGGDRLLTSFQVILDGPCTFAELDELRLAFDGGRISLTPRVDCSESDGGDTYFGALLEIQVHDATLPKLVLRALRQDEEKS